MNMKGILLILISLTLISVVAAEELPEQLEFECADCVLNDTVTVQVGVYVVNPNFTLDSYDGMTDQERSAVAYAPSATRNDLSPKIISENGVINLQNDTEFPLVSSFWKVLKRIFFF